MSGDLNNLTFSPCPIPKHRGELWEKLDGVDVNVDRFILTDLSFSWSDYISEEMIRADTFSDFTLEDWREIMKLFYHFENIFGMMLTFQCVADETMEITTFRLYRPQTHQWYASKLNKKAELWRIRIKEPKMPEKKPEPEPIHKLEEF